MTYRMDLSADEREMVLKAREKETLVNGHCEDYPCCGHTPDDPCTREWYDHPDAFNPLVNPHCFCEHEFGICDVPEYDGDDEDDEERDSLSHSEDEE